MKYVVSFGLSCVSSVCYQYSWGHRCNGNVSVLLYVCDSSLHQPLAYHYLSHIRYILPETFHYTINSGDQSKLSEAWAAIGRLKVCVKYVQIFVNPSARAQHGIIGPRVTCQPRAEASQESAKVERQCLRDTCRGNATECASTRFRKR